MTIVRRRLRPSSVAVGCAAMRGITQRRRCPQAGPPRSSPRRPIENFTLRLDRPFLFFVRDVETGAVLFMGRITDPSHRRAG